MHFTRFVLPLFLAVAKADFTVTYPLAVPRLASEASKAPCGGSDIYQDLSVIVEWPVEGAPVGLWTNNTRANYTFNVALWTNDSMKPAQWEPLGYALQHTAGEGCICLPSVPGVAKWMHNTALVQVVQSVTPTKKAYQVRKKSGGHAITW